MITIIIIKIIQLGLTANGIGSAATAIGTALGSPIAGVGLGLLTNSINNSNQLNQNAALLKQQEESNARQSVFNLGLQEKLWNDTNYSAQVAQAQKAGINPALLWSKGGSSGTTVANTVNNSQPAVQTNTGMDIASMINSINSSRKTNAEVPNINQNTIKQNVETFNTEINNRIAQVNALINEATAENQIAIIGQNLKQICNAADIAATNNWINQNTAQTKVATAQTELIQSGLRNILLQSENKLTTEQINQISQTIEQRWKEISIANTNAQTNMRNATTATQMMNIAKQNANTNTGRLELDKMNENITKKDQILIKGLMEAAGLLIKM